MPTRLRLPTSPLGRRRGHQRLTLSGDDAALFEIFDGDLFLRAGTVLDFEGGNTQLDVTV